MSSLIVIRIVPQTPIDAATFTNYLSNNCGLQISAYDLSYNSPTTGNLVGTAVYIAPSGAPQTSPTSSPPLGFNPTVATYASGTGIVQQLDLEPADSFHLPPLSAYYTFESVATAVIEFTPPSGPTVFENLRLVATW